jgi:hypothetical protein
MKLERELRQALARLGIEKATQTNSLRYGGHDVAETNGATFSGISRNKIK